MCREAGPRPELLEQRQKTQPSKAQKGKPNRDGEPWSRSLAVPRVEVQDVNKAEFPSGGALLALLGAVLLEHSSTRPFPQAGLVLARKEGWRKQHQHC